MLAPVLPPLSPGGALAAQELAARKRALERWREARSPSDLRHDRAMGPRRVDLFRAYDPHAHQRRFHRSKRRFKSICAGRRGGKTHAGAREFLRRIYEDLAVAHALGERWTPPAKLTRYSVPLRHYWAIAPTYELGLVQQREIASALAHVPELVLKWGNDGRLWLAGGALVEFRSAETPSRLVGAGLSGIWGDEWARAKRDAWGENARAALSERRGWGIFTTTPLGRNWFHDDIWVHGLPGPKGDPDFESFHFRTVDNVRQPALLEEVEAARRTMPAQVFRRNYEASFEAYEGQVYEHFSRATHTVDPRSIPYGRLRRIVGGLDWGYTAPGVVLECGIDGDGRWWLFHETYKRRQQVHRPQGPCWTRDIIEARESRGLRKLWCDPSRPENIQDVADYARVEALPADNAIEAGLDTVGTLLHARGEGDRPMLLISADCEHTIREFEGYRFGTDRYGRSTERPSSECDDHAMDAIRYATHSESQNGGTPGLGFLALVR